MVHFTTELYGRLQAGLQEINQNGGAPLARAEQAYHFCCDRLRALKEFTSGYTFKNTEEEILFFKDIKPKFLREMLYYLKLFHIEAHKPVGTPEVVAVYYQRQLGRVRAYFEQNQMLYLYYKLEKTHLDSKMFVSEPEELPLLPHYNLDSDHSFSNIYSFKLAKIQAYEDLAVRLQGTAQAVLSGETGKTEADDRKPPLVWKGTQAQFYEMVLGVVMTGTLGDVTIKSAMEWMGYCFGINVGHYYRYFQAMRVRKKSRTPYLEKCIEGVTQWMDDSDEHPRFH